MTWWICTALADGDEQFVEAVDVAALDALGEYPASAFERIDSGIDTLPEYPKREGDTIVGSPPSENTRRERLGKRFPDVLRYVDRKNDRQDEKHSDLKERVRRLERALEDAGIPISQQQSK